MVIRNALRAVQGPAAPAWCEIDLDALRSNTAWLKGRLSPTTELFAVVKCNAYGHGLGPVARTVLAAGASRLVVATLPEGTELRRLRVRAPVLVLGPLQPADVHEVLQAALTPAVADLELCRALAAAARTEVRVHVKVDTGMSRYGVPAGDAAAFARALAALPRLRVEGVFTHFSGRSTAELPAMRAQLDRFAQALAAFRAHGHTPMAHAASTLAALALPDSHAEAVRIGGGLYGFDPDPAQLHAPLRAVLSLKTRVAAVKSAPAGTAIGYGGRHVCERETRLAVLPLGYGDGLLREVWQGAPVLVRGRRVPIVGLINMNQTVVDVSAVPRVATGDEVVLLGQQGSERVRAEDRVGADGTAYSITCLLPERLPRVLRDEAQPDRLSGVPRAVRRADPAAPRRRP
jgi:alanine racemase